MSVVEENGLRRNGLVFLKEGREGSLPDQE